MLNRIKQVVAALTARITPTDRQFIANNLTDAQVTLFWRMNLPDQRHALNVAYTALNLAERGQNIDRALLIKCALLHDVGKVQGDVSTADKIITVILDKAAPAWARRWGRLGRGDKVDNLRHAIYIYYNHPARSAALLTAIASLQMTEIVAKHHEAPAEGDPPELTILRTADSLN